MFLFCVSDSTQDKQNDKNCMGAFFYKVFHFLIKCRTFVEQNWLKFDYYFFFSVLLILGIISKNKIVRPFRKPKESPPFSCGISQLSICAWKHNCKPTKACRNVALQSLNRVLKKHTTLKNHNLDNLKNWTVNETFKRSLSKTHPGGLIDIPT